MQTPANETKAEIAAKSLKIPDRGHKSFRILDIRGTLQFLGS